MEYRRVVPRHIWGALVGGLCGGLSGGRGKCTLLLPLSATRAFSRLRQVVSGNFRNVHRGSEQYQWHSNEKGGIADPDGPAAKSTLTGNADTVYTLPKASVTVIRGKVATGR